MKIKKPTPLTTPANHNHWIRLPKQKDRLCGLSRTTLAELCLRKAVKSALIKEPGASRGIRLIHLPSLLAYVERRASGGKVLHRPSL